MKAMMMVESGMDRHIATSPPSNGIAIEHLHQRHHPDANGGDHRCNCGSNPLDHVPCDDKTAHNSIAAVSGNPTTYTPFSVDKNNPSQQPVPGRIPDPPCFGQNNLRREVS